MNLYLLSDVAVLYSDIWVVYAFGLSYSTANYILTQISGSPTYPFLTWDSWESFLIVFVAVLVGSLNFIADATLT